jgi:hypothetical protein
MEPCHRACVKSMRRINKHWRPKGHCSIKFTGPVSHSVSKTSIPTMRPPLPNCVCACSKPTNLIWPRLSCATRPPCSRYAIFMLLVFVFSFFFFFVVVVVVVVVVVAIDRISAVMLTLLLSTCCAHRDYPNPNLKHTCSRFKRKFELLHCKTLRLSFPATGDLWWMMQPGRVRSCVDVTLPTSTNKPDLLVLYIPPLFSWCVGCAETTYVRRRGIIPAHFSSTPPVEIGWVLLH